MKKVRTDWLQKDTPDRYTKNTGCTTTAVMIMWI